MLFNITFLRGDNSTDTLFLLCFSKSYFFATFVFFLAERLFWNGCPKILFFPRRVVVVLSRRVSESCLSKFCFFRERRSESSLVGVPFGRGSGRWVGVAVCVVSWRVHVIGLLASCRARSGALVRRRHGTIVHEAVPCDMQARFGW